MLGSRINVLLPRNVLVLVNRPHTISPPSPRCSALSIPPLHRSSKTLQFLNVLLPLSLACKSKSPPHVSITFNPPLIPPYNSLPFTLAIRITIIRMRVLYRCYLRVRGCESDHLCLKQKNYEKLI